MAVDGGAGDPELVGDLLNGVAALAVIAKLAAAAGQHALPVIQDAAQAIGATYRGRPVGSGGLAAVSFNTNKIITTGGGGAVLTDDDAVADRARYLINQAREHPAAYRHGEVGFNYRTSNLHAALGCAQLQRIEEFIAAKRRIFNRYAAGLEGVTTQAEAPWAHTTRWFTTVHVNPAHIDADDVRAHLAEHGIGSGPPWTPLHLADAHRHTEAWPCPVAEHLARGALHLPCSVSLTQDQQDRVIDTFRAALTTHRH